MSRGRVDNSRVEHKGRLGSLGESMRRLFEKSKAEQAFKAAQTPVSAVSAPMVTDLLANGGDILEGETTVLDVVKEGEESRFLDEGCPCSN